MKFPFVYLVELKTLGSMNLFFVAIESALIMFPVTLLTVTMFRNLRPPPQKYKLLRQWELAVDANFKKSKALAKPTSSGASLATSVSGSLSVNSKPSLDKHQHDVKETDGMYTPKSTDSSKPASASTSSNQFKPSDNSSNSSMYTARGSESSEPVSEPVSEPETVSDYSAPSTGTDLFYREEDDEMRTPESNSDEVLSAPSRSVRNVTDEVEFQSVLEGDADYDQGKLPWWSVYIAWSLVMSASIAFTFVIVLYTFEFGMQKTIDWVKVVILSFLSGIFIQEPLKVVASAIVVAVIFKRSEDIQISNSDSITEDSVRGKEHICKTYEHLDNCLVLE